MMKKILFCLLMSLLIYFYVGSYQEVIENAKLQRQVKEIKADPTKLTSLISALEKKEKDAQGWYLLAKLYLSQQQYQLAADGFARAYALAPELKSLLAWQYSALVLAGSDDQAKLLKQIQTEAPQLKLSDFFEES